MPRVGGNHNNPIIRYAPYVTAAARQIFGNNIRPFERAFLNAGPGLGLAAAESIWNTYRNYQASSDSISRAYDKSEYVYQPAETGTDVAVQPATKRSRVTVLGGRGATGGSNPSASAAAQGTEYRRKAPTGVSQALVGSSRGSSSSSPMVRRIYAARRLGRRRMRFPGNRFRRTYRGGWSSQAAYASKRRLFRPERKYFDRQLGGETREGGFFFQAPINAKLTTLVNTPTAAGTANAISLVEIEQGTAADERLGAQITVVGIMIRGCIRTPEDKNGTTAYRNCVTVYVVQDRQSNGEIPTIDELLVVSTYTDPSTSMRNLDNRSRFKILAKRQMILIGGTNANNYFYEISVKKPIKVTYTGNTGTPDAVKTNNIWLLALDNTTGSGSNPVTTLAHHESLFTRTRFIDP